MHPQQGRARRGHAARTFQSLDAPSFLVEATYRAAQGRGALSHTAERGLQPHRGVLTEGDAPRAQGVARGAQSQDASVRAHLGVAALEAAAAHGLHARARANDARMRLEAAEGLEDRDALLEQLVVAHDDVRGHVCVLESLPHFFSRKRLLIVPQIRHREG